MTEGRRSDAGPTTDQASTGGRATAENTSSPSPGDRTAILPRVRERPDDDHPPKPQPGPRGVTVIPLRPVRTDGGYRSVYSENTRPTRAGTVRTVARTGGEILITLGLVVLLFAGYEVWGKTAIVNAEQNNLDKQLAEQWAQSPPPSGHAGLGPAVPPLPGDAIARLYVPRMGKHWVVVQGVKPVNIRYGPGHYPDTAMPGQIGNFSVAGHRIPAVFWDLDQLKVGDPIVVETQQTWYVYTVSQSHVVTPDAVRVVAPVPNEPGVRPTAAMLTLTTCNPKYNNYQRLIIHAELSRSQPVADGRPTEIGG